MTPQEEVARLRPILDDPSLDPVTREQRIAALYAEPEGPDPSAGLPPGATAQSDPDAFRESFYGTPPSPSSASTSIPYVTERDVAGEIAARDAAIAEDPASIQLPAPVGGFEDVRPYEQAARVSTEGPRPPEGRENEAASFGKLTEDITGATGLSGASAGPTSAPPREGTTELIPREQWQGAARGPSGPVMSDRDKLHAAIAQQIREDSTPDEPHPLMQPFLGSELANTELFEDQQVEGALRSAEAAEYAGDAVQRAEAAALQRIEEQQKAAQAAEEQRQQNLKAMEDNYRSMADDLAATPIDAEGFWNNKSTGDKIMTKLALALGTFGFGIAGSPNYALQQIESQIDRDFQAQKENKAAGLKRLGHESALMDMARGRFEDERVAEASARQVAYAKVAQQLEQFKRFAQTPEREAAIDQMMAGVNAKLGEAERARRLAAEQFEAQRQAMIAEMQLKRAQAQGAGKKTDPLYVPLWGARAPTGSEAKEARNKSGQYQNIYGLADYLLQFDPSADPTQRALALGAANQLALAAKAKEGPGAGLSSENDMKMLKDQIANPTEIGIKNNKKILRDYIMRVRAQELNDQRALGMTPNAPDLPSAD